jgi:hypothetical protein
VELGVDRGLGTAASDLVQVEGLDLRAAWSDFVRAAPSFRRQLLKIGRADLVAIFVEDPDVRARLRTRNGDRLESQRSAIAPLHNFLNSLLE